MSVLATLGSIYISFWEVMRVFIFDAWSKKSFKGATVLGFSKMKFQLKKLDIFKMFSEETFLISIAHSRFSRDSDSTLFKILRFISRLNFKLSAAENHTFLDLFVFKIPYIDFFNFSHFFFFKTHRNHISGLTPLFFAFFFGHQIFLREISI